MPSWVNRSVGLDLNVNYIAIHPATRHLSSARHILLAATDGGIYFSNNGGRQWGQVVLPDPSNAEFGDAPAAVIADLTFHWVAYDPTDSNIVYALGVKSSENRQWIYKTSDNLANWTSRGVVTA